VTLRVFSLAEADLLTGFRFYERQIDSRSRWLICGWGEPPYNSVVRTFTAVVERDPQTKLFVGYVPGFAGAHSQGATLEELRENLREVISMLLEDGEPKLEAEFVGTEAILV